LKWLLHRNEKLVERLVTYTLLKDGQLFVVENVPARVDVETGEQYFSPQTVERLQRILQEKRPPDSSKRPCTNLHNKHNCLPLSLRAALFAAKQSPVVGGLLRPSGSQ